MKNTLQEQYTIRFWQDNTYQLVENSSGDVILQSSLEEINAWLDLEAKGFDL